MERLKKIRVILTRFACTEFSQPQLSISGDKFFLVGKEGILHIRVLFPAFRKKSGGQRAWLAPNVFQAPLAQNNPYVKEAYFGVTFWFHSITIKCFSGGLGLVALGLTW